MATLPFALISFYMDFGARLGVRAGVRACAGVRKVACVCRDMYLQSPHIPCSCLHAVFFKKNRDTSYVPSVSCAASIHVMRVNT